MRLTRKAGSAASSQVKWADFIVVDRDFFEVPESEIDDIQVLQTWVGGELVFERYEDENSIDCDTGG